MKETRGLEAVLARLLFAGARVLPARASRAAGAGLGALVHALGVRRRVATANLAAAFPEWSESERDRVLREHYRELGRVAFEYARLGELARAAPGRAVTAIEGREHLEQAIRGGRGAILLSGHFGNFELVGAALGQLHPTDFVVRPLANRGVEALIAAQREQAGIGQIPSDVSARRIFERLRANRWVAMLADQDAGRAGLFVPFLGRPASTVSGPARIALATGAPIVLGFAWRDPDGRHRILVDPPLVIDAPDAPDAALRLTAAHVRRLEERIRERPESWFWLHRRWKTAPPPAPSRAGAPLAAAREG